MGDLWYVIPEYIIVGIAAIVFVLSLWAAILGREQGPSWMIWSLTTLAIYTWIGIYQPEDALRRGIVRLDLIAALANVGYWEVIYIIRTYRIRRRNGR